MDKEIQPCQAEVISNELVAKDTWDLKLKPVEEFPWEQVYPGKFVCLAPLGEDSSMARPFSIADTSISRGSFSLLYKIVGKNTKAMAKLVTGKRINIWGPLGAELNIDYTLYHEIWLIGGGIGIAPLNFFDRYLCGFLRKTTRVFYGSKTKAEIIPLELYTKEPVVIAAEDGTEGCHGFITNAVETFLRAAVQEKLLVITCGPNPMMKKMAEICAAHEIDCQVILETVMACGLNNCKGCSIKTTAGMKSVCHDGPVFNAKEVIWDELT